MSNVANVSEFVDVNRRGVVPARRGHDVPEVMNIEWQILNI